jgi:transposase-like protein
MNCPHCASPSTKEQRKITALGYRTFRYSDCKRTFNERTGTPFNFLEYSIPRAIRETLGSDVLHRTNRSLNNRLEQDHRGIKQRSYPLRGFGSVAAAARFCRASMKCASSFGSVRR